MPFRVFLWYLLEFTDLRVKSVKKQIFFLVYQNSQKEVKEEVKKKIMREKEINGNNPTENIYFFNIRLKNKL